MAKNAQLDLLCWRLARDLPIKDYHKGSRLIAKNAFRGFEVVLYISNNNSNNNESVSYDVYLKDGDDYKLCGATERQLYQDKPSSKAQKVSFNDGHGYEQSSGDKVHIFIFVKDCRVFKIFVITYINFNNH